MIKDENHELENSWATRVIQTIKDSDLKIITIKHLKQTITNMKQSPEKNPVITPESRRFFENLWNENLKNNISTIVCLT